jgi:hypothetical protein
MPFFRVIPNWYFSVGIGQYFSVFTLPILTDNSVRTFRYQKGGSAPLFPLLEKSGEERGEWYKKGWTIPTENTDTEPIWYRVNTDTIWYRANTDTEKMTGTTAVYNTTCFGPRIYHGKRVNRSRRTCFDWLCDPCDVGEVYTPAPTLDAGKEMV